MHIISPIMLRAVGAEMLSSLKAEQQTIESRSFEEMAIRSLRGHGYRLTLARSEVVYALALAQKPMSPIQVHAAMVERGVRTDLVSVYRVLDVLTRIGIAHKVTAGGGYMPCHLGGSHKANSAFLVCLNCGLAIEMAVDESIRKPVASATILAQFSAASIRIEVEGLCNECLAKKSGAGPIEHRPI